jgi:arylsulfatase A-like enzyme
MDLPRPSAARIELSPLTIFAVGLWFGLLAGFIELGIVHARAQLFDDGLIRKSSHLVWMLPAANVTLFALAAIFLTLPNCCFGSRTRTASLYVLCTLAIFSLLLTLPLLSAFASLILAAGIASWAVPAAKVRWEGFSQLVRFSLPFLALLWMSGMAWSFFITPDETTQEFSADRGLPTQGAPNVLLLVLDTVRAESTSIGDNERDTTPRLRRLAAEGARFDRAIASAPWTLPSHASLFTGLWPWQLSVGPDRPLDNRHTTLAESLGKSGYSTAGFVANTVFCTREYGLSRGFHHYEDYPLSVPEVLRSSAIGWLTCKAVRQLCDQGCLILGLPPRHPFEFDAERKTAARVNADALRWIDANSDRPFFVFLNYIDAHDPYLPPREAPFKFGRAPRSLADYRLLRSWIGDEANNRNEQEVTLAHDAYDSCIAYLDGQIGKLLDALEVRGLLENTVVIVTADHGEHFGEHERDGKPLFGHRGSLYQNEIHVPLIMYAPKLIPRGLQVREPVSLRELPSTVADLVELAEAEPFPGRSLRRFWTDETLDQSDELLFDERAVISEFASQTKLPPTVRYQGTNEGLMRAVVRGPLVYHRGDDGREELYDLIADPDESKNLADTDAWRDFREVLGSTLDRLAPTATGATPTVLPAQ